MASFYTLFNSSSDSDGSFHGFTESDLVINDGNESRNIASDNESDISLSDTNSDDLSDVESLESSDRGEAESER